MAMPVYDYDEDIWYDEVEIQPHMVVDSNLSYGDILVYRCKTCNGRVDESGVTIEDESMDEEALICDDCGSILP